MKKLLVFLLVVASVILFFHDKQQSASLAKAQEDNAQLTQQVSDKDTALNSLQAKFQQLAAQSTQQAAVPNPLNRAGASASATPNADWRFQSTSLDKPFNASHVNSH